MVEGNRHGDMLKKGCFLCLCVFLFLLLPLLDHFYSRGIHGSTAATAAPPEVEPAVVRGQAGYSLVLSNNQKILASCDFDRMFPRS